MNKSSDPSASLKAVRAKIDRIDEELHRLMVERTELARNVWKAKDRTMAGLAAVRPAREAQMLRAFAARHRGQISLPVLWRIWRELIIANIRAQVPVAVHVADGGPGAGMWDLARAHFGFDTEMTRHGGAAAAVRAAAAGAAIAVLPAESADDWAGELRAQDRFCIFDALPQIVASRAPGPLCQGPAAYLAGDVALEPTGADTSVVLVPAGHDEAMAAADRHGLDVNACRGVGEATLLGIAGLDMALKPEGGENWGGVDVKVLGGHADATVWDQ
ncbi:hypothetical protein MNBD_ALPHA09-626 [hydrothermal vent metagenome]|uniref:Chorismate mutase domain-containing protein n=1 Tax=hydrothermal vent metagenome TaxID=652676 RepID=A0A3B0TCN8_9ZZZZ